MLLFYRCGNWGPEMAGIWTQAAGLDGPCLELFYNSCLKTQILFLSPLKLFSHLLSSSSVTDCQVQFRLVSWHLRPRTASLQSRFLPTNLLRPAPFPAWGPKCCCFRPVVLGLSSPCVGRECPPLCFCRSRFHPLSCSRSFLPICSSPHPPPLALSSRNNALWRLSPTLTLELRAGKEPIIRHSTFVSALISPCTAPFSHFPSTPYFWLTLKVWKERFWEGILLLWFPSRVSEALKRGKALA